MLSGRFDVDNQLARTGQELPWASPPIVPPLDHVQTTVTTDPANVAGTSVEELQLTFCIWEIKLEAMHLKVTLLELERQPGVPPQSPELSSPRGSFDTSDMFQH